MVLLLDMVILCGVGVVAVIIFRRFNLPSLLGFLAAGIIAGPHALGLIKDVHNVEQMAEIGVIFLLFSIGIEFSLKELISIRRFVFLGGGGQVLVTIAVTVIGGIALSLPFRNSFFFGSLIALSSTAIVLKLLLDSGQADSPQGKLAVAILIFQDLCVVPFMLFVPVLAGTAGGLGEILIVTAKAATVIIIGHFTARFAVPWILGQVVKARSNELFLLTVLLIGLGTALLTAKAGLSLALGAFIAGLAISESEYSQQVLGNIIPFRDLFMNIFFVSVGMLLDLSFVARNPGVVIFLILIIILVKSIVTTSVVKAVGLPLRIAVMSALPLSQIGEFSFVLSRAGLENGLLGYDSFQMFIAASVATMAMTPFAFRIASPLADAMVKVFPTALVKGKRSLLGREKRYPMNDHVIIAGYGINGRNVARVLKYLKVPHIIIETNPFVVREERKRGEKLFFGDAALPEVLDHAHVAKARVLVVAISDAPASRRIVAQARQMNSRLHIVMRTRYIAEVEPLFKLGADEVIPEEFETSVEILSRVLRTFLIPQDEIELHVAEVRRDSYEMLRSMNKAHSPASGITAFLSGADVATYKVHKNAPIEGTQLKEGLLRRRSGATILAIKRGDEIAANPDPVWELRENDIVLVLGTQDQLAIAGTVFEKG